MNRIKSIFILAAAAGIMLSCGAAPVFKPSWQSKDFGGLVLPGGYSQSEGKLTVKGAGKGDVEGHFAYSSHPGGDFEIVVRIASISEMPQARAGIMVREAGESAKPATAQVSFCVKDTKEGQNSLSWSAKEPATSGQSGGGIGTKRDAPIWLRFVRQGKNFAVYKSPDGRLWVMISNVSGGGFASEGALEIGFFVNSGDPGKVATAVFDNISIGAPNMRYKTSWVGNSFGCPPDEGHVANSLSAMWVAPDGTCYTSSYWDEAGTPCTSYRDGKVLRPLPIGTPQTADGGITGDDRHIYVATVDRITELDPAKPDFAPRPVTLSVGMLDKKSNMCVISGMASNGRELFVADSRENIVRVVSTEPVKTFEVPLAANDGVATAPTPVAVPGKDAKFAPEIVYQTQRVGEGFRYTLPGFTAGSEYTVRCHFAEYVERPAKGDPRNRVRDVNGVTVNVAELAGGVLKPLVKDFPGCKADDKGNVIVNTGSYGGPGICGLEVLDQKGKRLFAINCGGPAVGDFKGESAELVSRNFPFERPGPMIFDKRGDLWIIQRGNDYPGPAATTAKYKPAVKCYGIDGKFKGREITDAVNPRALGYDAAKDQLLVAENGPDLNVRFYDKLDSKPVLARTFGEKGGIYSGKNPGLVNDPASGGFARFAGIAGVGVDAKGNLYVGGGFQGSDLRMFAPDGKMGWMLNSLMFCNTYDVDPDSDGADIYGTYNHLKLDLSRKEPGKEQKYVGYNWDLRNYGEPARAGGSQSIVRRLGDDRKLVMFTSGQGTVGEINIYRYEGEIAVPCGGTRENGNTFWTDANGDGKQQPEEIVKMERGIGWVTALCIDSKGDIWAGNPATDGSFMRHFTFKGMNDKGVPLYSGVKGDGYEDVRFPEEGDKTNAWGMSCRMDYDADRDIMVAFYPAVPRKGEGDTSPAQYFMGRYDNWSKGNRIPKWKVKAFSPWTDPDYFMYEINPYQYGGYMGIQVAGDYLFMAYIHGEIHVFDLNTGKLVEILSMGPEVIGQSAWEDAAMGLRAFKCKNGEYLIFTENSGWGGKNNFFRWKP